MISSLKECKMIFIPYLSNMWWHTTYRGELYAVSCIELSQIHVCTGAQCYQISSSQALRHIWQTWLRLHHPLPISNLRHLIYLLKKHIINKQTPNVMCFVTPWASVWMLVLNSDLIFIVLRHYITQAEVGPVHLDLVQLDVAHSVVDCTVMFISVMHYLLCWEFSVFLIHLRFSHSFSPSLSYFEWMFIPISSCFSFSFFLSNLFVSILGVKVAAFTPPFSNMPWFIFFSMCTKIQRLVSWHFAIYYWSLAGSVFHGTLKVKWYVFIVDLFFFAKKCANSVVTIQSCPLVCYKFFFNGFSDPYIV